MTIKRIKKRGGNNEQNPNPNAILNNLNFNFDPNPNDNMDISPVSNGSLHLSDLNVTPDSNASGLTTNESNSMGYFNNTDTHGEGQGQGQEQGTGSTLSTLTFGGKKRRRSRKSKKSRKSNKSRKTKKSRKSKKRRIRGGYDGNQNDSSPTPINEQIKDMQNFFN